MRVCRCSSARRKTTTGAKTDALAELLDLYPTLVELCGLATPKGLEGVSLAPVLKNPKATLKPAALPQHPPPAYYKGAPKTMGYSVRSDKFRCIERRDWKTGAVVARELYDHNTDRAETHNVAADPRHAKDLREVAELLERFAPIVRPGWKPAL